MFLHMYFHPARPPRTDKPRIPITRWQNSPHPTPNPGQIGFKTAKTQRPQRLLLLHPGEDIPPGAAGASLVRLFDSGGWILRQKNSDKSLGATASSDAVSTVGGEVGPVLPPPGSAAGARVPRRSARCCRLKAQLRRRCQMHTFWCHESSVPQLASGDLLSSALAVLPVPRTITHSAPQYISHCISCLIWQQN